MSNRDYYQEWLDELEKELDDLRRMTDDEWERIRDERICTSKRCFMQRLLMLDTSRPDWRSLKNERTTNNLLRQDD